MNIKLEEKCREFNLSQSAMKVVAELESVYTQFAEQNGVGYVPLLDYINEFIVNAEELSELTERDRFFYGLGIITISLGMKENPL